jgi:hypothetical protein
MTFAWYEVKRPRVDAEKRERMVRDELESRAALLYRLGYSAKHVKARLRENLTWDFELHGKPKHDKDIDRIVDAVFRRQGGGRGAPTVPAF